MHIRATEGHHDSTKFRGTTSVLGPQNECDSRGKGWRQKSWARVIKNRWENEVQSGMSYKGLGQRWGKVGEQVPFPETLIPLVMA